MNKEQIKTIKDDKDELNSRIKFYEEEVNYYRTEMNKAQYTLDSIKGNICFFQFETHEDAKDYLYEYLGEKASNDCEGSYNVGQDEYTQQYQLIVEDTIYEGKIEVQYDRHDKTYYYVDEVDYSFSEVQSK